KRDSAQSDTPDHIPDISVHARCFRSFNSSLPRKSFLPFAFIVSQKCDFAPLTDSLLAHPPHIHVREGNLTDCINFLAGAENKKTSALRRRLNFEDASALMHFK
ncbi:MAG: hypothetical protein K9M17_01150, partial [Mariprofundaceae bacterium]|nr:hypothetical protein [Mariprofundaceae bacterium]